MTTISVKRTLAVVFAALLALSTVAPFAAATAGAPAGTGADGSIATQPAQTVGIAADATSVGGSSPANSQGEVDPSLTSENASGTVEVVVRLGDASLSGATTDVASVQSLKSHAEATQSAVLKYADATDGVETLQTFWMTNAVLLEVDRAEAGQSAFTDLAGMQQVERVHRNFEVSVPEPTSPLSQRVAGHEGKNGYNVTYGLNQTNATDVWEEYDTKGSGVKVAVLDTGVSVDHPDIDLFTTDPSDPTYPGGWAEFDHHGEPIEGSKPHADGYHGTHTSGTVSGGNASGTWIGVAPNVSLMHGQVIPGGRGSFAQIIGGMQWAVEEDADVISMSLGTSGKFASFIEPVRNAEAAGSIVVASSGNSGPGTSGTPGNVFDAFAVGASGPNRTIAGFSSGELIDTSEDWGLLAPDHWPDEYAVPDIAAPGVNVTSAVPSGTFDDPDALWGSASGTSMAAPHVAGGIALMLAAADSDVAVQRIKTAFTESAHAPEDADPTRYGDGIMDIETATDLMAADSGVTGQIIDTTGDPIEDATVQFTTGISVQTDANGEFTLHRDAGTYTVMASAFGHANNSTTVTVTDGNFTSVTLSLPDRLDTRITSPQPDEMQAGGTVAVTIDVANLETLTVAQSGDYPTENATLYVNGRMQTFGEAVAFDDYTGEVAVAVATPTGTMGNLSLTHTVQGAGDETTIETGPTGVYAEPVPVAVVDTAANEEVTYLDQRLETAMPARYEPEFVPISALKSDDGSVDEGTLDSYEAFVVQNISDDEAFVSEFVNATKSARIGTVWLDNYGTMSDAIAQRSRVVGDPAATGIDAAIGRSLDVRYRVGADHEIFQGVAAPGEEVTLYTAPTVRGRYLPYSGFHSYFTEYSGLDATTVASISAPNGREAEWNPGLATDRFTSTVLAASLGRSVRYAPDKEFTRDANSVLVNSVLWATDTPSVLPEQFQPAQAEPASDVNTTFSVSQLDEYSVSLAENSTLSEDDLTLYVNGKIAAWDQGLAYDALNDSTFTVRVVSDSHAVGAFSLNHAFVAGEDDESYEFQTGATSVYSAPMRVGEDVDSVQRAVNLTPSGMEIVVENGTYTEFVDVSAYEPLGIGSTGLDVHAAEGADVTIQRPDTAGAAPPQGSVVHVGASGVTLAGVTVDALEPAGEGERASAQRGVFVDARGVTVQNVTATNAGMAGVQVGDDHICGLVSCPPDEPADGATVENVTVEDSGGGIYLEASDDATVTDSKVVGDNATAVGLALVGDADVTMTDNVVVNAGRGIQLNSSNGVQVTGNDVEVHEVALAIDEGNANTSAPQNLYVRGNNLAGGETGIYLSDEAGGSFRTGSEGNVNLLRNNVSGSTGIVFDTHRYTNNWLVIPDSTYRYNTINASETAVKLEADGVAVVTDNGTVTGAHIDFRLNYFGARGPDLGRVDDGITTDPFLTTEPAELNYSMGEFARTTEIAVDVHMQAGGTYAVGIPGPMTNDVDDVFGSFPGVVYGFDTDSNSWEVVHGTDELSALQALLVIPTEDARAVLNFQSSSPSAPGSADLVEGWNFVSSPQVAAIEDAYDVGTADPTLAVGEFAGPSSHLGPQSELDGTYTFSGVSGTGPTVSPFTGQFVFSQQAGTVPSVLTTNPTMSELYERLNIEAPIASSGESASMARSSSVADVLDQGGELDNQTRRTVSELLYAQMSSEIASEDVASTDAAMQVADGVASDALAQADTDAERELVTQAARGAKQRLLQDLTNANPPDGEDASQATRNLAPAAAAVAG